MTVFAIVTEKIENRGHGDSGPALVIEQHGSYGEERFHPLFMTWGLAERYLQKLPFRAGKSVMPFQLIDEKDFDLYRFEFA